MNDVNDRRQHAYATVQVCREAVTQLLSERQIFQRFADGVNASDAVQQTWFPAVVAGWYSRSMLMGLRRLGDRDKRTDSLYVLMQTMIAAPEAWSFDSVLELWKADDAHHYSEEQLNFLMRATYKAWADSTGIHLDIERVQGDCQRLESELEYIREVVDKSIAHAERGWKPIQLTFADLNKAIDVIHEIVRPYIALITGAAFGDMTPTEQVEWWRIFEPWAQLRKFTE